MTTLSTKDKLTLKLSRERAERWNRERLKPAKNPVIKDDGTIKPIRCRSVQWGGTIMPEEVIQPDRLDSLYRATDGIRVRTMAGKLPKHGERPTLSNAIRTQADGTTQVIVYNPARDYVDMEAAFAEIRKVERANMPMRVKRKLGLV